MRKMEFASLLIAYIYDFYVLSICAYFKTASIGAVMISFVQLGNRVTIVWSKIYKPLKLQHLSLGRGGVRVVVFLCLLSVVAE